MSEELNKNQEFNNEKYRYVPGENEELIIDKPSVPLNKVKAKKTTTIAPETTTSAPEIFIPVFRPIEEIKTIETTTIAQIPSKQILKKGTIIEINIKSNKELYESYVKELKYFALNINGEIIYDSSIDKFKDSPVKFENDYFILYGKKYSYNGLKIQKINVK